MRHAVTWNRSVQYSINACTITSHGIIPHSSVQIITILFQPTRWYSFIFTLCIGNSTQTRTHTHWITIAARRRQFRIVNLPFATQHVLDVIAACDWEVQFVLEARKWIIWTPHRRLSARSCAVILDSNATYKLWTNRARKEFAGANHITFGTFCISPHINWTPTDYHQLQVKPKFDVQQTDVIINGPSRQRKLFASINARIHAGRIAATWAHMHFSLCTPQRGVSHTITRDRTRYC